MAYDSTIRTETGLRSPAWAGASFGLPHVQWLLAM